MKQIVTETELSSVSHSNQAAHMRREREREKRERERNGGGAYSNDGGKKLGPGITSFCQYFEIDFTCIFSVVILISFKILVFCYV